MTNVLVTGGCGYIGSHTVLSLLEKGYYVYIIDSHCNSSPAVVRKLNKIILNKDRTLANNLKYFMGDLRVVKDLDRVFYYAEENNRPIQAVIHLAGLKSVYESVRNPLLYWDFNLAGTISLLKIMREYSCKNLIFSSSATIYSKSNRQIKENFTMYLHF